MAKKEIKNQEKENEKEKAEKKKSMRSRGDPVCTLIQE